jgi:hypothetical protein
METNLSPQCAHTYQCFNRSFRVELALSMLVAPMLVALWVFAVYYYYYSGVVPLPIVKAAVYFTITFIFAQIFYGNFRQTSMSKSIIIEKDKIIKKSAGVTYTLGYAGITNIFRPELFFFKKSMVFEASQNSLSIPLYTRGGHEMVERVFGNLEESGLFFEGLASLKQRFYDASKRFQILYQLRSERLATALRISAGVAILNAVIAMAYWERGLVVSMVWGYFNLCCQIGAYLFTEDCHVKKILKHDSPAAGDSFSTYYVLAGLIALLLTMILGIAATEPLS